MLFLVLSKITLDSEENLGTLGLAFPLTGEFSVQLKEEVLVTFYGKDQEELQNKYIDWGAQHKEVFTDADIRRNIYAPTIVPEGDISRFYIEIPLTQDKEASYLLESLSSLLEFSACRLSRKNNVVVISCNGVTSVINNFQASLEKLLDSWVKKVRLP